MKLSEKFARQETEADRLARIGRRRISTTRLDGVRRFLGLAAHTEPARAVAAPRGAHVCEACGRRFALPMHLGRHRKAKHEPSAA
jgi:hypothetical protein